MASNHHLWAQVKLAFWLLALFCLFNDHTQVEGRVATQGGVNLSFIPSALQGRQIRVGYVEGGTGVRKNAQGSLEGWMMDIVTLLGTDTGATYTTVTIPPLAIIESNNDSYIACSESIQNGTLDMCVGYFWETPEHRDHASFTGALLNEAFQLQVKQTTGASSNMISRVFFPFDDDLWYLLMGLIALTSLIVWICEWLHKESDDFPDDWHPAKAAGHSVYLGFIGTVSGGPVHAPVSTGGKITLFGLGFFVLVVTASYTANLAAFLTVSSASTPYPDLPTAIRQAARFCAHRDIASMFRAHHPTANLVSEALTEFEVGNGIILGTCDASLQNVEQFPDVQQGALCDLAFVGPAVLHIPVAFPINPDFEATISYWLAKYRSSGKIASEISKWAAPNRCPASAAASSARLKIEEMTGTFTVLGVAAGTGLIVAIVQAIVKKTRVTPEPKSETVEAFSGKDLEAIISNLSKQVAALQQFSKV